MDGDLSVLKTTQLFLSLLHARMKQSYFFFLTIPSEAIIPTSCLLLLLSTSPFVSNCICPRLLQQLMNSKQSEKKKKKKKKSRASLIALPLSLSITTTPFPFIISIVNLHEKN